MVNMVEVVGDVQCTMGVAAMLCILSAILLYMLLCVLEAVENVH